MTSRGVEKDGLFAWVGRTRFDWVSRAVGAKHRRKWMPVPSILILATLLASAHQVRGLGLCLGGADTFGGSQGGGRSLGSCGVGTMVSLFTHHCRLACL